MSPRARKLYALIVEVRAAFNRLKSISDDMNRDLGITAPMRAVMETIADEGPLTVPGIARRRGVTRQHIQVSVDTLADAALVELKHNPAHRRSPLVALSRKGSAAYREIRARESHVLEELAGELPARQIEAATSTLEALNARLEPLMTKDDEDD